MGHRVVMLFIGSRGRRGGTFCRIIMHAGYVSTEDTVRSTVRRTLYLIWGRRLVLLPER